MFDRNWFIYVQTQTNLQHSRFKIKYGEFSPSNMSPMIQINMSLNRLKVMVAYNISSKILHSFSRKFLKLLLYLIPQICLWDSPKFTQNGEPQRNSWGTRRRRKRRSRNLRENECKVFAFSCSIDFNEGWGHLNRHQTIQFSGFYHHTKVKQNQFVHIWMQVNMNFFSVNVSWIT